MRRQPVATSGNQWQPGSYWSHMGYGEDAWATGKLNGIWRGCLKHDEASWTMSRWQRPGVRVRMESRGPGPVPREYRRFADIEFFLSLQHRPSRPKTGPRPQPMPDPRQYWQKEDDLIYCHSICTELLISSSEIHNPCETDFSNSIRYFNCIFNRSFQEFKY